MSYKTDDCLIEDKKVRINLSPVISEHTASAAGFNTADPITSAILQNISGTLPTRKIPRTVRCEICNTVMSEGVTYECHLLGSKHKKKVATKQMIKELQKDCNFGLILGTEDDPNCFSCLPCNITVNSILQIRIHIEGVKHKNKVRKLNSNVKCEAETDSVTPAKKLKTEPPEFLCKICGISLNSSIQFNEHTKSRKHLKKGKLKEADSKLFPCPDW